MKKIFISFIFLLSIISVYSQKVTVSDKSDLQPVSQVSVSNTAKTILVTSDAKGIADITQFGENDTLVFNHIAYQTIKIKKGDISGKVFLTENIIKLDEVVFTANRAEEKKSDLPYKIEVIPAKEIALQNPQTSALMLEQTGNVFVQQSQLGGGSPVLRGFESNKVLLIVDGVRMNNAIYRGGHLQNAITVDPFALSSTEILYGPGSVIHGSDALGGVISFRTKDPVLSGNGMRINGDALIRYASANNEQTGALSLNLGWKKIAALLNISYSDFDNLREGKVRNPFYGDWGKCMFYVDRINGKDTMMKNNKPEIQRPSGYSQVNLLGKVLYRPSSRDRFLLNLQYSNSSDIPRYDRLTETTPDTMPVYSEWYYGPQERFLGSLNAEFQRNAVIFDKANIIIAYQNIHEDRISRKFGKSNKKFNLETVNIMSVNADFSKALTVKDNLNYGIEGIYNDVTSKAHQENINTGVISENVATRYPDQKATMTSFAVYASNTWKINPVIDFSQGARFSYISLDAEYSDTMMSIMKFPFSNTITQKNSALNGYLGVTATPGHDWKFSLVGSTGFRAPNIDDLTKLSESNSEMVIVPNPDLKPEYAYNLELSVAKTIAGAVRIEGTGFYTWLTDALVTRPSTYNGQDSILFDGSMTKVYTTTNAGAAHIFGLQGDILAQITKAFSIRSNLTYTLGRVDEDNKPLDHIPPVYGMTSFLLELKKFKGNFYVMYNGWKRLSEYSDSGEDNLIYATQNGMPSWYTLNLKLSYQVIKQVNVELGLENILDEHYRKFASGISSPGRNVIIALRGNF